MKFFVQSLVLALLLASTSQAFAEGFALYEFSARGLARGGTAADPNADPSTVAYNPALLTRLPGQQAMAGVIAVMPTGKIDTYDASWNRTGSTGMKEFIWPLPHAYYTHQINDRLFFGIGAFSRFGLGFEYDDNWPGRFHSTEVSLLSGSLTPNLAWAATDKLSLALGAEILYGLLNISKRVDTGVRSGPGSTFEVGSEIQDTDGFGLGAILSAHYQFNEQWSAGLLYRSQVTIHAEGEAKFENLDGLPDAAFDAYFKSGRVKGSITVPDSITGGLAWSPTPGLTLEATATWTRWSTFKSLDFKFDGPPYESKNMKDWRNAWRIGLGAEYQVLDWLALRAGFVWDESPMSDAYADYLVPTDGRRIYSLGAGFNLNEQWTLDVVYAYIDARGRRYQKDTYTHTENSQAKPGDTHTFGFSLSYKF